MLVSKGAGDVAVEARAFGERLWFGAAERIKLTQHFDSSRSE